MNDMPQNNSKLTELTDSAYWDKYWSDFHIPSIVGVSSGNQVLNAQLDTIDLYLSPDNEKSILEIGGAPGQYLAYFIKRYGFKASAIDYSTVGCDAIKKNFELLGLEATIYQQDLFSMDSNLPLFDIVYSLGVIEHFTDIDLVIEKHLALLKPGGILIIGVPYFIRVFFPLLKKFAPKTMLNHNMKSIDVCNWASFEHKFNLHILFKGYVGGFEPLLINSILNQELACADSRDDSARKFVVFLLDIYRKARMVFLRYFPSCNILAKLNSRFISAYALGIYRKSGGL